MSFATAFAAITKASTEYANAQGHLHTAEFVPVLRQRHPELFTPEQVLETCEAYVVWLHTYGVFEGMGTFRGPFEVVFYGVMNDAERQLLSDLATPLYQELWRVIHAYADDHGPTLPLLFACAAESLSMSVHKHHREGTRGQSAT